MTDLQRIKKVAKWLIFADYADNEAGLAKKLGYNKSSFSQILNGKVPLSDRFIDKLCELDNNINKVWVKSGVGEMLRQTSNTAANLSMYSENSIQSNNSSIIGSNVNGSGININSTSTELLDIIKKQQEQIDKLINIINKSNI